MTSISDRAEPATGSTLGGRYRIDALIGRGGMASVYRGYDTALGRPVAVKVFAEAAGGIDDGARRASEIALLASVEHRALVRLYDAAHDEATGREYLVMELVDGHDLRGALRQGTLGAADAAALLADLGEALHVIHARGIVHRDVKPANVLLEDAHLPSRRWNAKLADFGIARLIDDARLTHTGLLVGTPGYLSPEQVSGAAPGSAADVYSLGLLVLEARTGQRAFPGPAAESASARLARDPEIPAALGADWVELLRRMTAREPAARPSALEVAVAAAELETGATPVAPSAEAQLDPTAVLTAAMTGPTRVLPVAERSNETETGDVTGTTRVLAAPETLRPAEPPSRTGRSRRRPLLVALLALATVAVGFAIVTAVNATNSAGGSAPEPLPSVPAEYDPLGEHLRQLDEAVQG
ncbi:serine/threonine-protein kinase [Agromyces sp. NPDC058136]|uniref:serine/threonine-protein kinase n=1 Tax=Agromyces sp. NPDC058136 TaxID=3346354 RepID=UPI0036D9C4A2